MSFVTDNIEKKYGAVSFEVAIKSWTLGSNINCYVESHGYTYCFDGNKLLLEDTFYKTGINKDMVLFGIWYIKPDSKSRI